MRRPLLTVLIFSVFAAAGSADPIEWKFKVFLNDKEIGFHDYELSGSGERLTLHTQASFDVTFLFFNAFRYRHETTEEWEGGRLLSLKSETDNNGEKLKVDARLQDGHFAVDTAEGKTSLPAEVMSFAYWNPSILDESRLLNAQSGIYEEVEIVKREVGAVVVAAQSIKAQRYDIVGRQKTISVWYGLADQRWLALETPVKGGRTLRYEPMALPDSVGLAAALPLDG